MDRRDFLCSVAAVGAVASGSLPMPALAKPSDARTLRFVPHADLSNFDPIWNVAYIARNAGLLVWDTLYGVDSALTPRRQMIEAEQVSDNELSWTFRLRDGQKFHDNEVVHARDAVASINRWCARDPIGQMIKGIQNQLVAIDDRTFRWDLKKPFRKMLLALGKIATPCCFIMPERIALTDPFKPIGEYVGSGRHVSSATTGCPARGPYLTGSRITGLGRNPRRGWLAESLSRSIASNGRSFPIQRRLPPPCRMGRWIGGNESSLI
jgi:peptide/nickel transport system substrate-binding protein